MKTDTFFSYFVEWMVGRMWLVIMTILYGLAWGGATFGFLYVVDPSYSNPLLCWHGITFGGLVSSGLGLLAVRKWRKR